MTELTIVEPMPGLDVGRILVHVHIDNAADLGLVTRGLLKRDQVRSLDITALVDTDGLLIGLPPSDIARLGLWPSRQQRRRTAAGTVDQQVYWSVRVTVEDRDCAMEVAEVPEGTPALLGRAALQLMDFWIDVTNQRLAGNPEHGGAWIWERY